MVDLDRADDMQVTVLRIGCHDTTHNIVVDAKNILTSYIYVIRFKLYSISPNYDKNGLRLTCKLC